MADEVVYKFVKGQGWVPRTESDDFIEDFDKDVADRVRELLNAPPVGWTNEPIRLLQREFNAVAQRIYEETTLDNLVDCGVPNCEFCQAYRRER